MNQIEQRTMKKVFRRLVPFLMFCYFFNSRHCIPSTLNSFLPHSAGGTAPGAVLFSAVTTMRGGERS